MENAEIQCLNGGSQHIQRERVRERVGCWVVWVNIERLFRYSRDVGRIDKRKRKRKKENDGSYSVNEAAKR